MALKISKWPGGHIALETSAEHLFLPRSDVHELVIWVRANREWLEKEVCNDDR